MAQMNLSTKQKQTHRHGEQTCDLKGGGWEGRKTDWDFGVGRRKLLLIEWINNKVLLYSTVYHRELNPISFDKPSWKTILKKKESLYV